jgi:uncharacterized damage-inducible protein DinB
MDALTSEILSEFRKHKELADRAMVQLSDAEFFARPAPQVNSVAIIVKHLAGNLLSRWTDFLTSDGEKPGRNRDGEFGVEHDTRDVLMAAWERGWDALFQTLDALQADDLQRIVTIRGVEHTVTLTMLRGLAHAAYHTGQITYLVRLMQPDSEWLTIPPAVKK